MKVSELTRLPLHIIPPDDERIRLFAEKHGDEAVTMTLYEDPEGRKRAGADVYFGTMLICPEGASEDELLVRDLLAETPDGPLRLDYAYLAALDRFSLLRFGEPGCESIPYDNLDSLSRALAEAHIAEFMRRPHIQIIAERTSTPGTDALLFENEGRFLEGYMGMEGIPPAISDDLLGEVWGQIDGNPDGSPPNGGETQPGAESPSDGKDAPEKDESACSEGPPEESDRPTGTP